MVAPNCALGVSTWFACTHVLHNQESTCTIVDLGGVLSTEARKQHFLSIYMIRHADLVFGMLCLVLQQSVQGAHECGERHAVNIH